MTWVVGHASMFGFGIGISDIRVTLADGTERDCLQKIYPVGRFIASAFAGSVAIGLGLVAELRALLQVPGDADGECAWDPSAIAEWFPADARRVFCSYPISEQELASHVMLIGVHPSKHNGDALWPRSYVYRFRSPVFAPELAEVQHVVAIGCGEWVPEFQAELLRMSTNIDARFQLMQGEVGTVGGSGSLLTERVTRMVQRFQPQGISEYLHTCFVTRGRMVLRTNSHTQLGAWSAWPHGIDGKEEPNANFHMPNVATTIDELTDLLGERTAGAIA